MSVPIRADYAFRTLPCARTYRIDPTRSPVNIAEQGVILAQARTHAFDVYPREQYVAPGGYSVSRSIKHTSYFLSRCISRSSPDATYTILPATGSPNVRLCL